MSDSVGPLGSMTREDAYFYQKDREMIEKSKLIYFNIWDDYNENPKEGVSRTFGCVEEESMNEKDQAGACKIVADFIRGLGLQGLRVETGDESVYLFGLSHKCREEILVPALEKSNLVYNGRKFNFYSES